MLAMCKVSKDEYNWALSVSADSDSELHLKFSFKVQSRNVSCNHDGRVRTHQSTSEAAVCRLGRIIQRIFLPNQEPAFAKPFRNGLVKVGSSLYYLLHRGSKVFFFFRWGGSAE